MLLPVSGALVDTATKIGRNANAVEITNVLVAKIFGRAAPVILDGGVVDLHAVEVFSSALILRGIILANIAVTLAVWFVDRRR
jgi:hypothetical protein